MGQLGLGLQSPFVPSPTRVSLQGVQSSYLLLLYVNVGLMQSLCASRQLVRDISQSESSCLACGSKFLKGFPKDPMLAQSEKKKKIATAACVFVNLHCDSCITHMTVNLGSFRQGKLPYRNS